MFLFIKSKLWAASVLYSIAITASAQTAYLPAYPAPTLNSEILSFQCKKSFTGKGVGVCSGRIDVMFQNLDRPVRAAEFKCEVIVKYWWKDGQERRWEMKTLNISAPAERTGMRFANASLSFETDITSVVREPQEAHIAKARCEVDWQ